MKKITSALVAMTMTLALAGISFAQTTPAPAAKTASKTEKKAKKPAKAKKAKSTASTPSK